MVDIDIPVSEPLNRALQPLTCQDLALPMAGPLTVNLPSGGSLKAISDLSKGIPTDCSLNANLLVQIAPLLAALDCPMKLLKTFKGLLDILSGLPNVTKIPAFIDQVNEDLAPCFLAITPAGMLPFIKDLLKLVRSVLACLLGQLETLRNLMNGLSVRFGEAEGNPELRETIQCAQDNAVAQSKALMSSIDPIAGIIALIQPFASIANLKLELSLDTGGAPPDSTESLDAVILVLGTAVDAITAIVGD